MNLPERHERFLRAVEGAIEAGHTLDDRARRAFEILSARRAEDAVIESGLLQLAPIERVANAHYAQLAKEVEAKRVELAVLPPCADAVIIVSRMGGAQLGHPHDPKRRHFLVGHVGFIERSAWEELKATSAHRVLDGVFYASAPFTDLADVWNRLRNWRGLRAESNSPTALGALTTNLDKLVGSAPDSLVAAWFKSADGYTATQIRAAAQRNAGRRDPAHVEPWRPPREQAGEATAAE